MEAFEQLFPILHLPPAPLKIRQSATNYQVRCLVRRKFIVLTPEEWVRQHLLAYFNANKHYPFAFMRLEQLVRLDGKSFRADAVVYTQEGRPFLLVECKAATVELTEAVVTQIVGYNRALTLPLLLISNGLQHVIVRIHSDGSCSYLEDLPDISEVDKLLFSSL